MKLLFLSDSHGYCAGMYQAIESEKPDAVVHLGDCVEDAEELIRDYPFMTVYHVRGNNDFDRMVPLHTVIRLQGVSLYLTHGHKEHVYMPPRTLLAERAADEGCAFAFYGHTHRAALEFVNGVCLCNPGSISLPRGGPPTYGRVQIADRQISLIEIVDEEQNVRLARQFV